MEARPEVALGDVKRGAALHRAHLTTRAAICAGDTGTTLAALRALEAGEIHPALRCGVARGRGALAFVFPGHGSQWPGMGRALLPQSAAFAETLDACDRALRPHTGWSVTALLAGEQGASLPPPDRVDAAQIGLFAMGLGLAAVWRSLGMEPAAVVGHSVGEIAAAVYAEVISLDEGAALVARRGALIAGLERAGAMLAVQLPADELGARLAPWAGALEIGVVNTAQSAVASGDAAAIAALEASLQEQGVFCKRVRIGFAAHSAHMDPILAPFGAASKGLRPARGALPFCSSLTGGRLDGAQLDVDYWTRNIREVVCFDRVLHALEEQGVGTFVELGGHPTLTPAIREALPAVPARPDLSDLIAALDRGAPAPSRLLIAAPRAPLGTPPPEAALDDSTRTLALLQALLAEPRLAETALIWLTRGAVCTAEEEAAGDLGQAPLWGPAAQREQRAPPAALADDRPRAGRGRRWPLRRDRRRSRARAGAARRRGPGPAAAPRLTGRAAARTARERARCRPR